MKMSENARKAFIELQNMGVSVFEWNEEDGYSKGTAFVMIWANDDCSEVFADRSGEYIREDFIDGRFINPLGYRQDIHEVFKKYNLVTAWENEGQIVIYNDPDAAGYSHAD